MCGYTHALECVEYSYGSTAASASLSPKLTHHTRTVSSLHILIIHNEIRFMEPSPCYLLMLYAVIHREGTRGWFPPLPSPVRMVIISSV